MPSELRQGTGRRGERHRRLLQSPRHLRRNLAHPSGSRAGICAGRGATFHFHGVCFLNISVPLLTPRLRAALPAVPSPASSTAPRFSRLLHPSRDQFLLPSLCIPRCCRPGNTTGKEQGGKSRSGQPGLQESLNSFIIP